MKRTTLLLSLIVIAFAASSSFAQRTAVPDALKSYIETALSQNSDVMATRARWKNADAKVDESNAALIPHLDFVSRFTQYSGGRIVTLPNVGSFNTTGLGVVPWDNKFEFVWPIGNYAIWQSAGVSKALRDASTAEVSAKELAVTYQVSEAYYNYAKASELVSIRENAVALASENLKMAQALFSNDKTPKNDVLRAEVGVAAAQGDVLTAKNMAQLAKTNFNNLLKRNYDSEINIPKAEDLSALVGGGTDMASTDGRQFGSTLPLLSEDADRAFATRPELIQLMRTEQALQGVRRANWGDFLPSISLFASYGWQETNLKFSSDADLLLGGVQLQWNFFSGFGTTAKVHEAEAQLEELRYQTEAATNGIKLELESARLDKVNAVERISIAHKQLSSADENYRIVKLQYDNGVTTLITLLDAQTTFANAKVNLTTTTFDVMIADAKYKKALGLR